MADERTDEHVPGGVEPISSRAERDGTILDPLDEGPEPDPRWSRTLVVAAWMLAAVAVLPTGAAFVVGPLGMACGLVAHAKGDRRGFTAAVAAGVATVVGLCVQFLLLGGISGTG